MTAPALVLTGELTIGEAAAQHEKLRDALAAGQCRLDLAGIEACDSAGVQLLLAARRSAQAQGLVLSIDAPSAAVQESLQRYGLDPLLAH
jgi:phospholipid transport system transporter-binding protein